MQDQSSKTPSLLAKLRGFFKQSRNNQEKPDGDEEDLGKNTKNGRHAKLPKRAAFAAALWFFVLALGVLIPAEDYRIALGWTPIKKATETTDTTTNANKTDATFMGPPAPVSCKNCLTNPEKIKCAACRSKARQSTEEWRAFPIAAISYLPLNICILTIAAAFVGGCSVNKGELRDLEKIVKHYDKNQMEGPEVDRDRKRLNYLSESPGYSALRGIVVYLVIISGLLVAGGSPLIIESDQKEQLMQYFKLAGIFSFFGYLAGSDPTIFSAMIEFGSARLRPQVPAGSIKNQNSLEASALKTEKETKEAHQSAVVLKRKVRQMKTPKSEDDLQS